LGVKAWKYALLKHPAMFIIVIGTAGFLCIHDVHAVL
jgi:hypothetical protein